MRPQAVYVSAPQTAHMTGTATSAASTTTHQHLLFSKQVVGGKSTPGLHLLGRSACAAICMTRAALLAELEELKRTARGARDRRRASIVYGG